MKSIAEMFKVSVGEPIEVEEYTFYPLFNQGTPAISYISLSEAFHRSEGKPTGFIIREVSGGGSVNDLMVINDLDYNVLIFDGEQLRGAKQNRSINITSLIGANRHVKIPVSCIERGRWHELTDEISGEDLSSDRPSNVGSRRMSQIKVVRVSGKNRSNDLPSDVRSRRMEGVRERYLRQLEEGIDPDFYPDQHDVWEAIHEKHSFHGVRSTTGSMTDITQSKKYRLINEISSRIPLLEHQNGVLAFKKGLFLGMDFMSEPKVFADNFKSLLKSYLLVDEEFIMPVHFIKGDVHQWLDLNLSNIPIKSSQGVDLGRNWLGQGIWNCAALEYEEEIVHLTALPVSRRGKSIRDIDYDDFDEIDYDDFE